MWLQAYDAARTDFASYVWQFTGQTITPVVAPRSLILLRLNWTRALDPRHAPRRPFYLCDSGPEIDHPGGTTAVGESPEFSNTFDF